MPFEADCDILIKKQSEKEYGFMNLLHQKTALDKKRSNKKITDSKWRIIVKDILRPILGLLSKTRVKYKVIVEKP